MSVTADQLRDLMALGIQGETLLAVIAIFERDDPSRRVTTHRHDASRSNEADRAARYRAKRKQIQQQTPVPGVAMAAGESVTTVTTRERDASRQSVTNAPLSILSSFTDSQGIQKEESKKEAQSSEPRARRKLGARLPDDWQPSADDQKYAADRGMRLIDVEIEATKFRNYWTNRTDKQAAKPRWDRAWQNWILNVRGSNGHGPGRPENFRDKQRRETAEAYEQLREFAEHGADDEGPSGETRQPNARLLPFAKPA